MTAVQSPSETERWQPWIYPTLLLVGIGFCVGVPEFWQLPFDRPLACGIAFSIALLAAFYPPSRNLVIDLRASLAATTLGRRFAIALCVALASSAYLYGVALTNDRPLVPRLLDEKTYTVQSRMMANGMLWRPAHPKAEFFETFYIFDRPLYAPKYFPGTAMMYVPGVWIGFPDWVTSLGIAGAISGVLCLIVMELFDGDGLAGVSASLLLLAVNSFHDLGTWVLSHEPCVLCVMVMIFAWLRWRASHGIGWALLMGFAAGWGAITRPIDAACYALPMAGIIAWDYFSEFGRGRRMRIAIDLLCAALAASPFLVLQGIFDQKVTGSVMHTPYRAYIDKYQPGDAYGVIGTSARPQTNLQQKLDYFDKFILPMENFHTLHSAWEVLWRFRLRHILRWGIANRLALVLLPLGAAMAWFDRRLLVFVVPAPLMLLLYLPNPSYFWYYPVIVAPALATLIVAGGIALSRWIRPAAVLCLLLAPALAIGALPEVSGELKTDTVTVGPPPCEAVLDEMVQAPALVFFTYHPDRRDYHAEPVYAMTTGWPDDEPITRAQDLGAQKDKELIDYYAQFQPDRKVYVLDRISCELKYLGTAGDLGAADRGKPSTKSS